METLDPRAVHLVGREAFEELLQRDPGLHAGERRTQAEVDPVAECQMTGAVGGRIERVRVGVVVWVAIAGAERLAAAPEAL